MKTKEIGRKEKGKKGTMEKRKCLIKKRRGEGKRKMGEGNGRNREE